MGISAAIAAGAGLVGAGASLYGSSQEVGAENKATSLQQQMFQQLQGNLAPYNTAGQQSLQQLMTQLPSLSAPYNPSQLAQTPGYQFTLQQGENAVNNSNSALGWGDSGPGAKGIANYTTGLAQSTYNQQLQNYLQQNQQIYQMLLGPSQLGASAAAGQGQVGASLTPGIAATTVGQGNALAGGATGAAGALNNSALMSILLGNNSGTNSSLGSWFSSTPTSTPATTTGIDPLQYAQALYGNYFQNPNSGGATTF